MTDPLVAVTYLVMEPDGLRRIFRGAPPAWAHAALQLATGILIAEWWVPLLVLPHAAIGLAVGPRTGDRDGWPRLLTLGTILNAVLLSLGVGLGIVAQS